MEVGMAPRRLQKTDYTVGWICPLPIELAAAQVMLDKEHEPRQENGVIYTLGEMSMHNVVIASLPEGQTGTVPAAIIAERLMEAFKSIRFGLLVGIGGGVPSSEPSIRLGDVVISKPQNVYGGVVQYDFGKATPDGFERTGYLNSPPSILLNAVANLQANHFRERYRIPGFLAKFKHLSRFSRDAAGQDLLFEASYNHHGGADCGNCSRERLVPRDERQQEIVIHYGIIASGNQVMRSGVERDRASAELGGVLCFEMEAAGLMNNFPCLVIRGICDYADAHKNKRWQSYAAATAAACAKELLSTIPLEDVTKARKAELVAASSEFLPLLYENACVYEDTKKRNRLRNPGTCEWFTSHVLFQQWKSASSNGKFCLLYVTADPGCGKSVLCRHLIDHVLPQVGRNVCYFFFKEDFEYQKSSLRAICSLLHQLFVSNRLLLTDDVLQKYVDRGKPFFQSFDSLWEIFLLASGHEETVCVLDGLDECQEEGKRQLIDAVTSVCNNLSAKSQNSSRPRFLITSRPYEHLRAQLLQQSGTASIHLQGDQGPTAEAIAQEIQLVLDSRIRETAEFFRLEPDEREIMRAQLESVPNRTYLWITLLFDGLMSRKLGITKSDIMNLTRDAPQSVHDAYEKILNKSPDVGGARKLLHIMIGATRPLSLSEMSLALAILEAQNIASAPDRVVPSGRIREYIRDICGLFAVVVDNKIYLLHQTAREFLICKTDATTNSRETERKCHRIINQGSSDAYIWQHSISIPEANLVLATICMSYILSPIVTEHSSLLPYAALYWADHYRQTPGTFQDDMADVARSLCLPSGASEAWQVSYNKHSAVSLPKSALCIASAIGIEKVVGMLLVDREGVLKEDANGPLPLFKQILSRKRRRRPDKDAYRALCLAASNNREAIVILLLQSKVPADLEEHIVDTSSEGQSDTSSDGQSDTYLEDQIAITPLLLATIRGHYAIVKLLLEMGGANANNTSLSRRPPLSYAAEMGYETIVRLLIDTGHACIDSKDVLGRTALSYACSNGQVATVKALLRYSVDIDSIDGDGRTPLSHAAQYGHETVAELLLHTGNADVNSSGRDGRTPLSYAAESGFEGTVKVLVDTGRANVDFKDKNGRTPLLYATKNGHVATVGLMILRGADVTCKDNTNMTALWCAAFNKHTALVTMLVDSGRADVDSSESVLCQTPLWYAASTGRDAMVKLLLETGQVNVNGRDYYYHLTPLCAASKEGHAGVVSLLLASGRADINAVDRQGRTALLFASANGYDDIVKLFLETNIANVDAADKVDRTPLSYAAGVGHVAIVRRLVESGRASVVTKDIYGRMPLSHAAMNGHCAVAKLLIDGEANINSQDEYYGRTALSYAAANGHVAVVELLLEYKAVNVDTLDEYCRSPLSYAAANGHERVVNLLVEVGRSNINLEDIFGRTPFSYAAQNKHEAILDFLRDCTGKAGDGGIPVRAKGYP